MARYTREAALPAVREHRGKGLSPSAGLLLLFIADRIYDGPGELYAKLESIAEWTGTTRSQVTRDLASLERHGLIEARLRKPRRPTYWTVLPGRLEQVLAHHLEHPLDRRDYRHALKALRAICAHGARYVSPPLRALCATEQEEEPEEKHPLTRAPASPDAQTTQR